MNKHVIDNTICVCVAVIGCYADTVQSRDLSGPAVSDSANTLSSCRTNCFNKVIHSYHGLVGPAACNVNRTACCSDQNGRACDSLNSGAHILCIGFVNSFVI